MLAVVDTNVLVSRFVNPKGTPATLFRYIEEGVVELVVSRAILDEYSRVLVHDKLRRFHGMSDDEVTKAIKLLEQISLFVSPPPGSGQRSADPDDDIFLDAAASGEADFIVSGDRHLLALGSYEGIQIVTPAMFIAYLERETQ